MYKNENNNLYDNIFEGILSFIKKYPIDIKNINLIDDYLICDTIKDAYDIIKNSLKKEIQITYINEGIFTLNVNDKYLLISKEQLKNDYKLLYKNILIINKKFDYLLDKLTITSISSILSCINLLLIFCDNITFYSFKKRLISKMIIDYTKNMELKCNIDMIIITLKNEYTFTQIINKKKRKSANSWAYRTYIFEIMINNRNIIDIDKVIVHKDYNYKLIDNFKKLNPNIIPHKYMLNELSFLHEINETENRNYHMWVHIRKIYNFFMDIYKNIDKKNNNMKKIDNKNINQLELITLNFILFFSIYELSLCPNDYSAYTFIINSKLKDTYDNEYIIKIIQFLKDNKSISNIDYTNNIEYYLLNN